MLILSLSSDFRICLISWEVKQNPNQGQTSFCSEDMCSNQYFSPCREVYWLESVQKEKPQGCNDKIVYATTVENSAQELLFFSYLREISLAACKMNNSTAACSLAFHVYLHVIPTVLKFLLSLLVHEDVQEVNVGLANLLGPSSGGIPWKLSSDPNLQKLLNSWKAANSSSSVYVFPYYFWHCAVP